ncbi:serine/threonine-protein kinase [Streptomyces sp. NP-1717]|uniref:serine/threonine-protein kinase n=1 Tax=Streptomyces sp. NP-1717 TaxID=2704470 RepID=UPI001F5E03B4|nr:serine/threonine-protein kinase [Streptomyces sp. NP-1717]MCI3227162.1 protein kinase [Streptomyces sp. NP-1717]
MDELRPQDPARIGVWQILARLGAGGMGQVYLGRSPGGRLVAVKVIRDEISDHPESLARFRREAATMETVRSPYTAQLIEASLDASPYWLATEYVPGPTLRDAVLASGPFPPESALGLFAALAEGLATVHVHGVTHRDLKPQNVILAPQGPQLIDFGIARGLERTILTQAGMAPGTPGYAAPEVLLRNEVGPAADVFALGATIAYAATGRPPYGAGEASAVSYRTVHEDIDLTGVRDDLAGLVRRCVAKDPADRPELAAVITGCAVDSALAADAHYRSVARDAEAVPDHVVSAAESEPGAAPATRPAEPARWGYDGTTPYAAPDPRPTPATRPGRRKGWLAVCALGLVVPLALWLLPGQNDDGKDSEAGTSGATTSGPSADNGTKDGAKDGTENEAKDDTPQGPPDYIVNDRDSQDRWTLSDDSVQASQGIGFCDLGSLADASPPRDLQSSVSHTTGSGTASVAFRPKDAGKGKRPAPYYVSVGVRPPHETDRTTGRPLKSTGKGIGFTTEPVDLYSKWSSGGTIKFRYPEDFQAHFGKRTVDAIPVSDDPGDWTVVLYHVEGGPTKYTSIVCNGFHA